MPTRLLSETERARLDGFPQVIAPEDVITYFTLSAADRAFIAQQRGPHNQLGCALQLGTLRFLGFCPDQLQRAPTSIIHFLAQQLAVAPDILSRYAEREQTRTAQLQKVCAYLGFRAATEADLTALSAWLLQRALEHDQPLLLFQWAADKLRAEKQVRPGVTRLERLVASVREKAQQEIYQQLKPCLTPAVCTTLDQVLVVDPALGTTPLEWLHTGAVGYTASAILEALRKRDYLRERGVLDWALTPLTPNYRKFLAQLGRHASNQLLQRMSETRRYPILLALLRQTLEDVTDEMVELYDRYLAQAYRRAGHKLTEFRHAAARTTNEQLRLFRAVGRLVLDPDISDAQLRATIYQNVPQPKLQHAVDECDQLIRPAEDHYFDFLAASYPNVRTFAPQFLAALDFQAKAAHAPLLKAIKLLRELNTAQQRKVPADAPTEFVSAKWRPYVVEHEGQFARRYYELCVLWELREALRAGNVWVTHSRRYADPESYLLPRPAWEAARSEICHLLQVSTDGTARLAQLRTQLTERATQLEQALKDQTNVRIENGRLVVSPLAGALLSPSTRQLQAEIGRRLPRLELSELLIEVDGWTHFTHAFEHAGGNEPRTQDLQTPLYAVLLANACNFGLDTMAELAHLTYARLTWCENWYVRAETLRAATNILVNYHFHLPLSRAWGGGTLASSDGQRFPAAVKTANATPLPRYFGYGRGLTFYTWTSDQFSQFGTKVIPTTTRDATVVLDELLGNETELPVVEHTTDTAGFTEIIFALFDLLGLQFAPRIRDVGDQRLFRFEPLPAAPKLDALFKGTVKADRILSQWDDMLRLAGSLKRGWVTASLLISKLQAAPRRNVLSQALQEYGRPLKTLFILRYASSEPEQRRIEIQLNKGEALHALRRFIFFAHQGRLRQRQQDDQANQAWCLNLVTNAVIVWNTVYMAAVIEQLKREGYPVQEDDLKHLSPARYDHINPYGQYHFNVEEVLNRKGLRPLRPSENGL